MRAKSTLSLSAIDVTLLAPPASGDTITDSFQFDIDSLMYFSQNKLICTTKQGSGDGRIELKTSSGGIGVSSLIFTFNPAAGTKDEEEMAIPDDLNSASKKDLIDLVYHLQKKIKERDEDLNCLRQYIDKILLRIIDKEPSILEGL